RLRLCSTIGKHSCNKRLRFIQAKENLILTGSPGTGKTHLATSVGFEACKTGLEVRFYRVSNLVESLEKAWKEDRLASFQSKFKNVDLVILDEIEYVSFTTEVDELFFQLF
ncbi:ATP-binding protein, partial [Virgibacillus pantothenticus]